MKNKPSSENSLPAVLISFANSEEKPLDSLKEEDSEVYERLSQRKNIKVFRDSYATLKSIAKLLPTCMQDICIFLFSGHAGKDYLILEDQKADAGGIAAMLGQCPNLKLVVLNGCSTLGQVDKLLEEGIRVVIATSSPVEDTLATEFSKTFFDTLNKGNTIDQSFEFAAGYVKCLRKDSCPEIERGLLNKKKRANNEPLWGKYFKDKADLEWRLPEVEEQYTEKTASEKNRKKNIIKNNGDGNVIFQDVQNSSIHNETRNTTHQNAEKIYNIDKIDEANFE